MYLLMQLICFCVKTSYVAVDWLSLQFCEIVVNDQKHVESIKTGKAWYVQTLKNVRTEKWLLPSVLITYLYQYHSIFLPLSHISMVYKPELAGFISHFNAGGNPSVIYQAQASMLVTIYYLLSGWYNHCNQPSRWELGRGQTGWQNWNFPHLVCGGKDSLLNICKVASVCMYILISVGRKNAGASAGCI